MTRSSSPRFRLGMWPVALLGVALCCAPAVQAAYPAANFPLPFDAMAQVVGDGQFVCEGRRVAKSLVKCSNRGLVRSRVPGAGTTDLKMR